MVIGLNLCPFAAREWWAERVRIAVCEAHLNGFLLEDLQQELHLLEDEPEVETTLMVMPNSLQDFLQYNDFLDLAESLLVDMHLEGVIQIASFHPDYCFADAEPDDPANHTNRSPYPMLHLIREASLAAAVAGHPAPQDIPERNINVLRQMGNEAITERLIEDNAKHT